MTGRGDYEGEMPAERITTDQAEALVAGALPPPHLGDVAAVLTAVAGVPPVAESRLARIVADVAPVAAAEPASPGSAGPVRIRLAGLRRRVAALAAAVTLLVGGGAGAAVAADGAAPGDVLYGLDRALEVLGIRDGGAVERLDEVEHLVLDGDVPRGLEHAAEMIRSVVPTSATDRGTAVAALESAAERVRAARAGGAGAADGEVSELLEYLAGHVGAVDGRTVAELSHRIGRSDRALAHGRSAPPPGAGTR